MGGLEKRVQKCRLFCLFRTRIPRICRVWKKLCKSADYSAFSGHEFPEYAGFGKNFAKVQIILPFPDTNSQNMPGLEKTLQKCRLFCLFRTRIPRICRVWKNLCKSADYSAFSGHEFPEYAGFGKTFAKLQIILPFPDTNFQNMPGLEKPLQNCRLFCLFRTRISRICRVWKNLCKIADYSAFS